MEDLISQKEVNYFMRSIEKNLPNFLAGVITDKHGRILTSKISKKISILENTLALSAIAKQENFIDDSNLIKFKKDLDKSKFIKLLVLLDKSREYKDQIKSLKTLIDSQKLF